MVEKMGVKRRPKKAINAIVLILFALVSFGAPFGALLGEARAAGRQILFDAEMETVLRAYANPLLRAAGLKEDSVTIIVVANDQINALASPGLIQLHSGLVLRTQTPMELQGVLAHEIAHIAGGHTTRLVETVERSALISLASILLGIGAIVAGVPELGAVFLGGGSASLVYQQLGASRLFEASADQAALNYMTSAGLSGQGLLDFFAREFQPRELFLRESFGAAPSPYLLTHPLTSARLEALEKRVALEKRPRRRSAPDLMDAHRMMKAKLFAFLKTPSETLTVYPLGSRDKAARYAHALTFSKQHKLKEALRVINGLIAEDRDNPYFHEMKAYILTQAGKVQDAIAPYKKAAELASNNPILNLEIGRTLLDSEDQSLVRHAIPYLKRAVQDRKLTGAGYRAIARAHDILGDRGMAELATAESYVSARIYPLAFQHARRALAILDGSEKVSRLRAQDIIVLARAELERQPPQPVR